MRQPQTAPLRTWRLSTLLVALILHGTIPRGAALESEATPSQISIHRLNQDLAAAEILQMLMAKAVHGAVVFRNVRVVDPVKGTTVPGRTVVVSGSKITWVGPATAEPKLADATIVEGADRYLAPGLVDMHVHTNTQADFLLDISAGVTTVRDMAGFPWLLKSRDAVDAGKMLAPTLLVAGPLINADPLEGYAVVPADPVAARRLVRREAACGYDFIKVHNVVPRPIFDAVAEEARALDLDLVGHVPHDIPVRYAVEHGMRTLEHLKGFLNDATLTLGETDYAAAAEGREVWSTPTLYPCQGTPRGEEGRARLASPEMRYVPVRRRRAWARALDAPEEPSAAAARNARVFQLQIVSRLNAAHARFLAGTDSANYPLQVRGFALLDELRLLHEAGLSPVQVLRAATTEPALAMRDPLTFGEVREGFRADLLLLAADPTADPLAFRKNEGVMVRGRWLDRATLDAALAHLAQVEAEEDAEVRVDAAAAAALAERLEAVVRAGLVVSAPEIENAAGALRSAGYVESSDRIARLAVDPDSGPCAEDRPR